MSMRADQDQKLPGAPSLTRRLPGAPHLEEMWEESRGDGARGDHESEFQPTTLFFFSVSKSKPAAVPLLPPQRVAAISRNGGLRRSRSMSSASVVFMTGPGSNKRRSVNPVAISPFT